MKAARGAFAALGLIAAFSAGVAAGRLLTFGGNRQTGEDHEIREGPQRYTNPLLECEIANDRLFAPLRPFGSRLDDLVASLEKDRRAARIAVYFRDLNNGPWVGHHETEEFVPASLAKVPILIACFRQAETDPGFLLRRIAYEGFAEERQPGFLNPEVNLRRGMTYTVDELLLRIAKYSDNAAAKLLAQALPPRLLQQVYFDLGIDPQRLKAGDFALSPKEYGAFLRVLYNASYLSKGFSERALQYLGQSSFELGLVAGVPDGVEVAHKFGVWEQQAPGERPPFQLHDCGIVYHPQRPYLLCVMTTGDNYVNMAAAIAAISRFAYQEVDRAMIRPGDWDALTDAQTAVDAP